MSVKPIRTRAEHGRAIAEIERLMGAKRSSAQADRLEVLGAHMSERGLGQADLARLLGSRSLASAILNRKRPMSLSIIRRLAKEWDIPTDILVQPYRLEGRRSSRAA
ncbi:MAG TPA: hypothetical protein VEP47_13280 [Reyranella sp.]|jgi:HTH-type transcriptional regulator/antitoxin HigA|nr:hypothetical protein [Reyranella sp.]